MSQDQSQVITVRLVPALLGRLDSYAREQGLTRADAVRHLLAEGLSQADSGVLVNRKRETEILEFLYNAMGAIIARTYAADRTQIIKQAIDSHDRFFMGRTPEVADRG